MTPYYEQDGIVIYHGDCRDVVTAFAPESVDCIVTDPPYGVSWKSTRRTQMFGPIAGDDGTMDVLAALVGAVRCLKGRRHMYAFGRWALSELGMGGECELVWNKELTNPTGSDAPWSRSHEYVSFAVKANTAQRAGGTGNRPARLRRGSVLTYQRLSGCAVTSHPTEKPVALLREFIESSTHLFETVLDPFVGSGSTLIAAHREGRKAIGIELEEKYCEIAAKRLAQGALDLFGEATA